MTFLFAEPSRHYPSIPVARATIWPDTNDNWLSVIGTARPSWLDIYRDFPPSNKNTVGPPRRGTLIVSTDEEWLRNNSRRLVSTLYFLGDLTVFAGQLHSGRPSELFYFLSLDIEGVHPMVRLLGKHGWHVEDENHLKLTPPYPLRGDHRPYELDIARAEHTALIRLLADNPEHRLVTACVHYFLAQTGDPMVAWFEQDYANYCASLEAALDVVQGGRTPSDLHRSCWLVRLLRCLGLLRRDQVHGGIPEQLIQQIGEIYQIDGLNDYIRGLYSCRSIHDHGLSDFDEQEIRQQRHQAYLAFLRRRGNYVICRAMCRDIILRRLQDQAQPPLTEAQKLITYQEAADSLIHAALHSDEIWAAIRSRTQETGSAARIAGLAGDDLEKFRSEVDNLLDRFEWEFMQAPPSIPQMLTILHVYLDAHQRSAGSAAAADRMLGGLRQAFQSAQNPEREIALWALDESPDIESIDPTLTDLIALVARKVATFFPV
jgi:hypothetical protein